MMSGEQIRDISTQAAARAARQNRKPLAIWPEDVKSQIRNAPFLGDYVPQGWRYVQVGELGIEEMPWGWGGDGVAYCVDNSGFGSTGEPAMTLDQIIRELELRASVADAIGMTLGIAGREAGQFQVYLGLYVKEEKASGNEDESIPNPCPHCKQDTSYAHFVGDVLCGEDGYCGFCGQPVEEDEDQD